MESKDFGTKLKELRKLAGLSQRQLADRIGVNFSYLSKIESGKMPPPSEQIIMRLAEVLDTEKDELLTLAGKIPSDIAQLLKSREALEILRSERIQKKIKKVNRKEGTGMIRNLNYKKLSKLAVPIVLVCAVAASLWFAAPLPARAFTISITKPPTGTLGQTHSFSVTIDIITQELVPIQSINMEIYKNSSPSIYKATCNNLPLTPGATKNYTTGQTGGGAVSVTASSPSNNWAYFYSTSLKTYWQGTGYNFAPTYGYGYQIGAARITYSGTWTSPSSWPAGTDYKIKIAVNAASSTLSETFVETSSSFTLNAPAAPPVGGGGGGGTTTREVIEISAGVYDITDVLYSTGAFRQDVSLDSADRKVKIDIAKNTVAKTSGNKNLTVISLTRMSAPPDPPEGKTIIGLVYDLKPDGTTFNPAITLTFTYDPDDIPNGVDEEKIVIAVWVEGDDDDTGKWVELENCIVNPATHTITTSINHFTPFTILGTLPVEEEAPAAFALSDLSVSPAEVDIGDMVSISVVVANTGDLSGSYDVNLKINGAVVETKSVTLEGGSSQTVSFTTSRDSAGTYTVTIDSQIVTFTVKAPPEPAAFTVSNLRISPAEVNIGDVVSISVVVANTGDLSGSYDVSLEINGAVVETKSVTVAGSSSQTVSFATSQNFIGTYTINVDTLSGSFTVTEAPPTGIDWWAWVIVGLAILIIGTLVYFLWWRRRYTY